MILPFVYLLHLLGIFSDIKSYTSSEMIRQVQSSLSAIVRAPIILPAIS